MNIATHPVIPEETMALLDGELPAAEAQALSSHVEGCAECSSLAAQLRSTSQSLSAWKVPPIPKELEEAVTDLIAKPASDQAIPKPRLFIRPSFWGWKQWTFASGGTIAVVTLVLTISLSSLLGPRHAAFDSFYDGKEQTGVRGGDRDRLQTRKMGAQLGGRTQGSYSEAKISNNSPAPMIARTVSLIMVVKDFAAGRSSLDSILNKHHGYSAQLNASTAENAPRNLSASLRIPAAELSSAVADLKAMGRVENESQSGEEVTQQHADLVARLKTSRDTEQRFRTILEQRPGKVAEVLEVEEEIARVRGDIERMEAEQKALEHRVDFATVELQLTEEYKAQLNPPAASVSTLLHNALVAGYHHVSDTILGTVLFFAEYGPTLLLWLSIAALPIILLWRRYRRTLATV